MTLSPTNLIRHTGDQNGQAQPAPLPQQTLNQNDFLKLLVAQLSAQDPMNPMQDTQFIAQMAQFSSLQQTQGMRTDLASLQASQSALQANALLGRTVQVLSPSGQVITGAVTAFGMTSGTPNLTVNGQSFNLGQVLSVSAPVSQH
jgi:flagellar basal-body rod modification protein FlgD